MLSSNLEISSLSLTELGQRTETEYYLWSLSNWQPLLNDNDPYIDYIVSRKSRQSTTNYHSYQRPMPRLQTMR